MNIVCESTHVSSFQMCEGVRATLQPLWTSFPAPLISLSRRILRTIYADFKNEFVIRFLVRNKQKPNGTRAIAD